ncbi:MAG: ABC transporter substrate-binding protein [Provencibacterium sp.]|jgi:putative aldouronate transport system substrate-binding protein|nr:ABC transporter substrate-binding protein [Provencibacterium sp.]
MKRIIALCLTCVMTLGLFAGCSASPDGASSGNAASGSAPASSSAPANSSSGANAPAEAPYEVNFLYVVASTGSNMDKVRAQVNELALREINMSVNLIPMIFSEFQTQLPMMLAANESLDLFLIAPGLASTYIESQYIVNVEPYLDRVDNIKKYVGDFISAGYVGDFLTGFPIMRERSMPLGLAVRKDILNELGYSADDFQIDSNDISSYDQLLKLFAEVKAAHPEMTVFDGTVMIPSQVTASFVDGRGNNFGVLANYGQDTTVTNVYESEMFRDFCNIMKTWYDSGYSSQDLAVNTDSGEVKMKAGNTFSILLSFKPNTVQEKLSQTGYELEIIPLSDRLTRSSNAAIFAVANASKDPAKAVEFFDWAYGSAEFTDLINWGIEGEDWVENADGTASYPDGVTASNVGYHQDMGWMYPNQFAGHQWEGNPPDILEQYNAFNNSATFSKAFGFAFDSRAVVDEIVQLTAVEKQYLKDLSTGVVDVDATLEEFNKALYVAGLQKVMDEKQKQLDAWLAQQ